MYDRKDYYKKNFYFNIINQFSWRSVTRRLHQTVLFPKIDQNKMSEYQKNTIGSII